MSLPVELKNAIDKKIENISLGALQKHSEALSWHYREAKEGAISISSDLERLSYLSVRMPATYAAISLVLRELLLRSPDFFPQTILDMGAGPGTALWAVDEVFGKSWEKAHLLEKDGAFIQLGRELYPADEEKVQWKMCDMTSVELSSSYDLVLASFSLGEIHSQLWKKMLSEMWKSTKKIITIIEPGTPKGFERIKKIRGYLIEMGAHLVAPCPHFQNCPIEGSDWCHFGARVQRSSIHRNIKKGTINYEDEKFCYLIFSKDPIPGASSRVLSRPQKHTGFVKLKLCTPDGIKNITVSKKSKEIYKKARKVEWGDSF